MEKVLPNPSLVAPIPPPPRHGAWLAVFVAISLLLHLAFGFGLHKLVLSGVIGSAQPSPPSQSRRIEVEVVNVPPELNRRAAPKPPASAETVTPTPPVPTSPRTNRIVELPAAPEAMPDRAKYLSDRNMRAAKDTIARKLGEAQNQRQDGEIAGDSDRRQEAVPAQPGRAARFGTTGMAKQGVGNDAADQRAARGGEVDIGIPGDGLALRPGSKLLAPETQAGGGRQSALPTQPGQSALLPSGDRLAKLIEPSQRNLIQAERGDITLLNARSSAMAAYIIHRAKRIYSYLNINAPMLTVFYDDVANLRFPIAVEAALDRQGRIQSLNTIHSSGSPKIDRLVAEAARSGLEDSPPPPSEGFVGSETLRFRFALYDDHIEAGTP